MNRSRLISMTAIACGLALSVGCETMDIPPVSQDSSPDRPELAFEPSHNPTIDAYDLIVYDRIERKWQATLDTLSSQPKDYQQGRVSVIFRLHQDGRLTDLEITERTVNYRQTAACWEAIMNVRDLPPWPQEVTKLVHREYRDLSFTFYYSIHNTRLVRDALFALIEPYDRDLMTAMRKKWHGYLDATPGPMGQGEVTVEFMLHQDGTVTDARVTKSLVKDRFAEICRRAVLDSGPFPAWPEDLRNRTPKDHRRILIHFYFEK